MELIVIGSENQASSPMNAPTVANSQHQQRGRAIPKVDLFEKMSTELYSEPYNAFGLVMSTCGLLASLCLVALTWWPATSGAQLKSRCNRLLAITAIVDSLLATTTILTHIGKLIHLRK